MDYGNTKTPSTHRRLGSMTVAAGFPQEMQLEFPMEKIPLGQYSTIGFNDQNSFFKSRKSFENNKCLKLYAPKLYCVAFECESSEHLGVHVYNLVEFQCKCKCGLE